jgi:hypothetical protein
MMMMMSVNDIIKKIDRIMIIRGIWSKALARERRILRRNRKKKTRKKKILLIIITM